MSREQNKQPNTSNQQKPNPSKKDRSSQTQNQKDCPPSANERND